MKASNVTLPIEALNATILVWWGCVILQNEGMFARAEYAVFRSLGESVMGGLMLISGVCALLALRLFRRWAVDAVLLGAATIWCGVSIGFYLSTFGTTETGVYGLLAAANMWAFVHRRVSSQLRGST